jgi:hypothetical protein
MCPWKDSGWPGKAAPFLGRIRRILSSLTYALIKNYFFNMCLCDKIIITNKVLLNRNTIISILFHIKYI